MKHTSFIMALLCGNALASPLVDNTLDGSLGFPYLEEQHSPNGLPNIIDISGLNSWDLQGDTDNESLSILMPFPVHIVSISWDLNISTVGASWLSEPVIGFEDQLFITPGIGDDFAGTASYSSGGFVDLVAMGLDFFVSSDSILDLEFFESFDDVDGQVDATFGAGSTIEVQFFLTPPTPGATSALAIAGLMLGRRKR